MIWGKLGVFAMAAGVMMSVGLFGYWQYSRANAAEVALSEQRIVAEQAKHDIENLENQVDLEKERTAELAGDLQEARDQKARMTRIFNEHNLGALLQAKPGLIESRAKKATAKVWNDIEAESRE